MPTPSFNFENLVADAGSGKFRPYWQRALSSLAQVISALPLGNLIHATAASRLLGRGSADGEGEFQQLTVGPSLAITALNLDTVQDIQETAAPTFATLTLTTLPTSAVGLTPGQLWNDAGTLRIA